MRTRIDGVEPARPGVLVCDVGDDLDAAKGHTELCAHRRVAVGLHVDEMDAGRRESPCLLRAGDEDITSGQRG